MDSSLLDGLSGDRKAAILILMLGEEASSRLFEHLSQRDVARIAREVAELGPIDPELSQAVLEDYYVRALRAPRDYGGPDQARKILSRASIDEEIADKLIRDSHASDDALGPLMEAPPEILARALQDEHPQTAALVLLHLPPPRAAQLLAALPEDTRAETVLRMATLRRVREEVLGEVATSLHQRLLGARRAAEAGDGISRTALVLESVNRIETRRLLDELEADHPEQVQELRERLFTFESLIHADDRGMQELLRQVDTGKLGVALVGGDPKLIDRFLSNLSERASNMLREEMEFLGTPNPQDQQLAQKEILDSALQLEADGSLTFTDDPSGEGEE